MCPKKTALKPSLSTDLYFRLIKMAIKSIKARQIFDSRGNPTVEVDLVRK